MSVVSLTRPWRVDLIDCHGAGTFVCQLNTGRGIGTEPVGWTMCFLQMTWFASAADTNYTVIYSMYLNV